jgi:hypothetical protein
MTTEARWVTNASPAKLLYDAKQLKVLKPRKSLLFACGCYRLVWEKIQLPSIKKAVEAAEARADRKISQEELSEHRYPQGDSKRGSLNWHLLLSISSLVTPKVIPTHIAWLVRAAIDPDKHEHANKWEDCKPQADLVREILGNPYRRPTFKPAWLAWNDATVVNLAHTIYDDRAFDRLPILADALEDAGCDNADLLSHCRSGGEHVRGCWAVDLLLGKQ